MASVIGTTSDGHGALGVAVANHSDGTPVRSLYLAEGGDITEIPNPAACDGTCVASKTGCWPRRSSTARPWCGKAWT